MRHFRACMQAAAAGFGVLALGACGAAPDEADPADPVTEASSDPVAEAAGDQPPEVTGDYEEATVLAAQACHDKVWLEDARFSNLPNAAVSIDPASLDDDDPAIGWTVEWDDPKISAAGTCTVDGTNVSITEG